MKMKFWSTRLRNKSKGEPVRGPVGTIAFYGPDNRHVSKVAVGVTSEPGVEVSELQRWFEDRFEHAVPE